VLANDPFRSLQALPGVSASANNDFLAQFSVMGAPYEQVGVYVDDVLVPNLLHSGTPTFPMHPLSVCLPAMTSKNFASCRLRILSATRMAVALRSPYERALAVTAIPSSMDPSG